MEQMRKLVAMTGSNGARSRLVVEIQREAVVFVSITRTSRSRGSMNPEVGNL